MAIQGAVYDGGELMKAVGECRPDPEEMLQRARRGLSACDEAERLLFELGELPLNIQFGADSATAFHCALGSIRTHRYRLLKDEQRWLAEIDK